MKIALTGASGLVGSRIVELLSPQFEFIPLSQKDVDITAPEQVEPVLESLSYDLFLHLAAYTDVDGAEKEPERAHVVNVDGTRNLFDATQKTHKPFIYISTDFVFSGTHPPYDELSVPNPISVYGKTKHEGEQLVKDKAMIVRFAYPYRAHCPEKKDFATRLRELMLSGQELTMVTDAAMTPTFIDDIAHSLSYLFTHFSPEIFHIVGSSSLSPYEAGITIAQVFDIKNARIHPTSYASFFAGHALRPQYATITSTKNTFHPMKSFEEGMREVQLQL
ncbi:MAG: NAD(P)-dependent oxidoreductase [Candidatus Roizmanbacteria bacterium]|nr:NAD(P)-dependent oxidoreductase [Candidatus Roizmanbacteria bacterium]